MHCVIIQIKFAYLFIISESKLFCDIYALYDIVVNVILSSMFWMKCASRPRIIVLLEFCRLMHIALNAIYFKFSSNKELLNKVLPIILCSSLEQLAVQYYLCKVHSQLIFKHCTVAVHCIWSE